MGVFRLTVAYDGSAFAGWQRQPQCRTVEGELSAALTRVLNQPVRLTAASRTDAGVHALGQVAVFEAETRLQPEVIARAVNGCLPPDVCIREVWAVEPGYDLHRDIRCKRYRYWISDSLVRNPFLRTYQWQWLRGRLDHAIMGEAAQHLVGTHDFACFQSAGSPRSSTVRTLFRVEVERLEISQGCAAMAGRAGEGAGAGPLAAGGESGSPPAGPEDFLRQLWGCGGVFVLVEGDGFLYNMVRAIVGTLVEVGRGVRPPQWVAEVLKSRDRRQAGPTAPACGLYLEQVILGRSTTDFKSAGTYPRPPVC